MQLPCGNPAMCTHHGRMQFPCTRLHRLMGTGGSSIASHWPHTSCTRGTLSMHHLGCTKHRPSCNTCHARSSVALRRCPRHKVHCSGNLTDEVGYSGGCSNPSHLIPGMIIVLARNGCLSTFHTSETFLKEAKFLASSQASKVSSLARHKLSEDVVPIALSTCS
jgi:hypothetical protein